MEVIETHATHRQRANSIRALGRSLLLPLLAVGVIGLSLLALVFVDAGTTQFSVWVSDADGKLQQRVEAISLGAPLLVRPEGAESSPAPLGCAGRGRQVVVESKEANAGEALLAELAARNIVPCGGLSFRSNVRPSDASALDRLLAGWPQLLDCCAVLSLSPTSTGPTALCGPSHRLIEGTPGTSRSACWAQSEWRPALG